MKAPSICVAQGFTEFPSGYVARPHIVSVAKGLLMKSATCLLVEGDEGIGITTFLVELLSTGDTDALYLHIKNGSRISYSVPYLIGQLLPQVNALVGGNFGADLPTVTEWRKAVLKLQQRARRGGSPLVLVIDGLYQIPEPEARYVSEILTDLMCLGVTEVRHVIAIGRNGSLAKAIAAMSPAKPFELMPLSRDESLRFLRENSVEGQTAEDVVATARGNPGVLNSAVRLVKDGELDVGSINGRLTDFLAKEWDRLVESTAENKRPALESLYAHILFSRQPFLFSELTERVDDSEGLLRRILDERRFISQADHDSPILIASATARKFLEAKLSPRRVQVIQENISLLIRQPKSRAAVELLPSFYDDLGNASDLIAYLTPEVLDLWFVQTSSLNLLKRRTELGLQAASAGKCFPEMFRFSLETSAVRGMGHALDSSRAKLAALAEMGNFEEVLALTQEGTTAEGRVILLADYAKIAFRKKAPIDPLARDRLTKAIEDFDQNSDHGWVIEVATAIVGPFPDLAITAVDKALSGNKQGQDLAYSRLAITATSLGFEEEQGKRDQTIYASKISDTKLQAFVAAIGEMESGSSLRTVKAISDTLSSGRKVFFLRNWLKGSDGSGDALEVAIFALDEIAKETAYTPNAADLCDIIQPALDAGNNPRAASIASRIEAQIGLITATSSSIDLVRLNLALAISASHHSPQQLENRLLEIFYSIEDLQDMGIKLEAMAWMLAALEQMELPEAVEANHKFRAVVSADLLANAQDVLDNTADHLHVASGAVRALCPTYPEMAKKLVEQFNIEERRDDGFLMLAESIIETCQREDAVELATDCLKQIVDPMTQSSATVRSLRRLAKRKNVANRHLAAFDELIEAIGDPLAKSDAISERIQISAKIGNISDVQSLSKTFLEVISQSDEHTTIPEKVYRMVRHVAEHQPGLTSEIYANAEAALTQINYLPQELISTNYYLCKIAVASFSTLAAAKIETPEHLLRLTQQFETVPSVRLRAILLNDLALRMHFCDRRDLRDKICADILLGTLNSIPETPSFPYAEIVMEAVPALYVWNQSVANSFLRKIPAQSAERSISLTAVSLLSRTSSYTPHNDEKYEHCALTFSESVSIVDLIERIYSDADLVMVIEGLVSALKNRINRHSFTGQQKVSIIERLSAHARKALPNTRNIRHEGWLIYAECVISTLGDPKLIPWQDFIDRAKAIPNKSDAVFVFGVLANNMPSKMATERATTWTLAETALLSIPSAVDQATRAVSLSSSIGGSNRVLSEKLLDKALRLSLTDADTQHAAKTQRKIIDAAYQLDDKFAERLAELIDDDPARRRAKQEIASQMNIYKGSSAISKAEVGNLRESSSRSFGKASYKALGSLNAQRTAAPDIPRAIAVVQQAAGGKLEDNWPAYIWFLQAAQIRLSKNTERAAKILLPIHEMVQLTLELTTRLGSRIAMSPSKLVEGLKPSENYIVATPGSRGTVLTSIVEWLTQDETAEEILICDPYFKAASLELVWMVYSARPMLTFCILTHLKSSAEAEALRIGLIEEWKKLSDNECPSIAVIGCCFEENPLKCPIHDRWILARTSGVQLGTSVSDIGAGRLSAADHLQEKDVENVRGSLNRYLMRGKRNSDGQSLRYVLTST